MVCSDPQALSIFSHRGSKLSVCACDVILPAMLFSLPARHFPFRASAVNRRAVGQSVEALASRAFNMLVVQAVEQLRFGTAGRDFSLPLQQDSGKFKS